MIEWFEKQLVPMAGISFVLAILAPFVTVCFYQMEYNPKINGILGVDNIGSTADFLSGTITPFLTMAAFFLLLKSYLLQKEELKLTREEMRKTATALEQQRQIMEAEKKQSLIKNEMDIFLSLFNNWNDNKGKLSFKVFMQLKNEPMPRIMKTQYTDYVVVDIDVYGEHIDRLLQVVMTTGKFEFLRNMQGISGAKEHSEIIRNLTITLRLYFSMLTNMLVYIDTCNSDTKHKNIMLNIIKYGLSYGENAILKLYISDTINDFCIYDDLRLQLKEKIEKTDLLD